METLRNRASKGVSWDSARGNSSWTTVVHNHSHWWDSFEWKDLIVYMGTTPPTPGLTLI